VTTTSRPWATDLSSSNPGPPSCSTQTGSCSWNPDHCSVSIFPEKLIQGTTLHSASAITTFTMPIRLAFLNFSHHLIGGHSRYFQHNSSVKALSQLIRCFHQSFVIWLPKCYALLLHNLDAVRLEVHYPDVTTYISIITNTVNIQKPDIQIPEPFDNQTFLCWVIKWSLPFYFQSGFQHKPRPFNT
jgi:hypothetical protein